MIPWLSKSTVLSPFGKVGETTWRKRCICPGAALIAPDPVLDEIVHLSLLVTLTALALARAGSACPSGAALRSPAFRRASP
jgi:hypothetical protein